MSDQINEVATLIRDEFQSLPVASPLRCIYKVPDHIRRVKDQSYRPCVVSIGPIYYHEPSLQPMQQQKLRHLQRFIAQGNIAYNLEYYISIVTDWEGEIRGCYAEEVILPSNEFIKMVLVDAAFIIDLFMWSSFQFGLENHPVENMVEVFSRIEQDLFLQENQLSFFVLNRLYDRAFGTTYSHISFIDLTWSYIGCGFMPGKDVTISTKILHQGSDIKHFVDFLRICCLPSKFRAHPNSIGNQYPQFPMSATELSAVGVRFLALKTDSLLDIKFTQGVLQIPKFIVQDTTDAVFRSITFYEHSHHFLLDSHFIDYVYFIGNLIKTSADVEKPVKKGIIENWLGNDEVANLFNSINKNTSLCSSNFYYYDLCRYLNSYANTSWHRWKAILSKDYFNHPWAIISVLYATVLLILTLLQTISSFISK